MTVFDDVYGGRAWPVLAAQHGVSITYSVAGTDDVTVTALRAEETVEEYENPNGGRIRRRAKWIAISTDPDADSGGVAAPSEEATVTINDEVWAVDRVEIQSGKCAELYCLLKSRKEISRPRFREVLP